MIALSVIICTHNPNRERLFATLEGLKAQSLSIDAWETILVDNASRDFPSAEETAVHAPKNLRVSREPELGLTAARKHGLRQARAAIVVFVDDDNILAPDYLALSIELMNADPRIGAAGGRSFPTFEINPEPWHQEFFSQLALRDLGEAEKISTPGDHAYPDFAPIGAGLILRTTAAASWLEASDANAPPDRRGSSLSSAGDNDLVFTILKGDWSLAYFPRLRLTHLIPSSRLESAYLARLNRGIQESWLRVLQRHDVCPWPAISSSGALMRKARAWVTHRAWRGGAAFIRWQGACGHFDGRVQRVR